MRLLLCSLLTTAALLVAPACTSCAEPVGKGDGDKGAEGEGEGGDDGDECEGEGSEGEGEPALEPRIAATAPGTFAGTVEIALSVVDVQEPRAFSIWFTIDGSVPVAGSSRLYEAPFVLAASAGVRAIAVDLDGVTAFSFFGSYVLLDADLAFSSNLPVLLFWSTATAPEDKEEEFTPFTMSVFEPALQLDGSTRTVWPRAATESVRSGIKIRGSSSAGYPKHPWRVETWGALDDDDDGIALLAMPNESDWVLNAPLDFDRALMRNSLAFSLSNAAGRYAPRTRFAEVFIVSAGSAVGIDDYVGLYEVTEHVKRDDDRVPIEKLLPSDITAPEVTGGYIFKEDRTGPGEAGFRAGEADGAFEFQQPFTFADPDEVDILPAQLEYLTGYLDDVGEALDAPSFVGPSGSHYSELIDVDAFIDHHILNVFTKNPDALRLSGYFHKDRDGPLVAGPIWDFDRTMGCSSDGRCDDPTWWDASNVTGDTTLMFEHGFYRGLFNDPTFRDAYWARMGELLAGPLAPANVSAFIDASADVLDEPAVRNFARWSDYAPRGSYRDEVELLRAWTSTRHAWMSACLALPDPRECEGT